MSANKAESRPQDDILIVDDTPENLQLLAHMLSEQGYKTRPVLSGRLALQAAEREPPDLILLDINMPDLRGYEVCEQLKANPRLKDIPVIFLSARTEPLDKVRAFRSGGVDYVTKPFDFEEVQARVATHVSLRRLRQDLEDHNRHLEEIVRQRTRELAEAQQRLLLLGQAKDDFLHLISHELRTPLNGILGFTDLVFERLPPDTPAIQWKAPYREAREKLLRMLEDALLLTQVDVQREQNVTQPVNLQTVLAMALSGVAAPARRRGVRLGLAPEGSTLVLGNQGLLQRAFSSLLDTALKFCEKDDALDLACDAGPGVDITASRGRIPADILPRFFEVFAVNRPIVAGGNLGLGPPVADRLLSLMGGSLAAENLEPAGVRFHVTLRAAAAGGPG